MRRWSMAKTYDGPAIARMQGVFDHAADESLLSASDAVTFTTLDLAAGYRLPPGRTTILRKAAAIAAALDMPPITSDLPLRILTISNLHPRKRLADLIPVMRQVRQRVPRAELRVVGGGPASRMTGAANRIAEAGLSDAIVARGIAITHRARAGDGARRRAAVDLRRRADGRARSDGGGASGGGDARGPHRSCADRRQRGLPRAARRSERIRGSPRHAAGASGAGDAHGRGGTRRERPRTTCAGSRATSCACCGAPRPRGDGRRHDPPRPALAPRLSRRGGRPLPVPRGAARRGRADDPHDLGDLRSPVRPLHRRRPRSAVQPLHASARTAPRGARVSTRRPCRDRRRRPVTRQQRRTICGASAIA